MIISAVNGPVALLRLIQSNVQGSRPYEKMLNAAISVLKAVSVEELNKRMIIRAGTWPEDPLDGWAEYS